MMFYRPLNVRRTVCLLLFLAGMSSIPSSAPSADDGVPVSARSSFPTSPSTPTGTVPPREYPPAEGSSAREKAEQARLEADSALKEAELQEKTVVVEKKKAAVELKEAELAREEAEVIQKGNASEEKINEAIARAEKEIAEARIAREKARIAEEKMVAAQEQAELAAGELELAQERAALAEEESRGQQSALYSKLIRTGLVLLIGYLLIFALIKIINTHIKVLRTQHLIRKNVIYFLNLLIILLIIFIWLQHISSITIFISAVGAGVALALQEVILCTAGWLVILMRRPFEVGDRIEFGDVKGDVIDIQILQTSLLELGNWVNADQSTGRIVNVPNSAIFKKPTFNYSRGFEYIWNELRVLVTFESDWKRAEEIMLRHAVARAEGMEEIVKRKIKRMSRRYMIHYGKLTPIVYVNIKDSGVELTLRYLTDARKRRSTEDEFSRRILEDFEKEEKVNFAYPTYRIVKE
ncbi:MAG: mechanosensitive ion channel domain-containing protein [PVC group bacterium]